MVFKNDLLKKGPSEEYKNIVVRAAAFSGPPSIVKTFSDFLASFAETSTFMELSRLFLNSREDKKETIVASVLFEDGTGGTVKKEVVVVVGNSVYGDTMTYTYAGDRIDYYGSNSEFAETFLRSPVKDPDLFFIAMCYLDEEASTDYDVYDLASGELKTVQPSPDLIKKALNSIGQGQAYVGVKQRMALG